MSCPRCGKPVQPRQPGEAGGPRKWCSARCRKQACAERRRAMCPDCGEPMRTGSAWAGKGAERCRACHDRRAAAAHRARLEDVAEMYREGMTVAEIAAELGYGPNSTPHEITEAFQAGLLTEADYRLPKGRRANMRAARWG